MPKVQQGDNARQLKWHQAHQNFYDRRPEYEPPKHRLGHLLQLNPEAYNTNRFSIFHELFERLRFQSTIVRVAVWILEFLGVRPVAFGETLSAGTRLTLFSDDKRTIFLPVIKF
jgi:hypothetical protein